MCENVRKERIVIRETERENKECEKQTEERERGGEKIRVMREGGKKVVGKKRVKREKEKNERKTE